MDTLATLAIAVATALAGAYIGYWARWREFRREHRLTVYGECVAAFLDAARVGAAGLSVYMQLGESLYGKEHEEVRTEVFSRWEVASRAFESAAARLRLVASKEVREACAALEGFLDANVRVVPPFLGGKPEPAQWGGAASQGPRQVDEAARWWGREFAEHASRDVVPSRERFTRIVTREDLRRAESRASEDST